VRVALTRWSAWAPGRETQEAWRDWARAPEALSGDGSPAASFIPSLLRRRATPLTRTLLTAAWGCLDAADLPRVRSVFASRHGSINESIGLLENVVRREKLSPTVFSHTVHNAQAALFSIAAGNRAASSSLAGQEDSFPCGWVEALTFLEREPETPLLLVMGDVPLAETFAGLADEPDTAYALACRLESVDAATPGIELGIRESDAALPRRAWPQAFEFLRWWLSDEPSLALGGRKTYYEFRRA
jgi:hypothetical protein